MVLFFYLFFFLLFFYPIYFFEYDFLIPFYLYIYLLCIVRNERVIPLSEYILMFEHISTFLLFILMIVFFIIHRHHVIHFYYYPNLAYLNWGSCRVWCDDDTHTKQTENNFSVNFSLSIFCYFTFFSYKKIYIFIW